MEGEGIDEAIAEVGLLGKAAVKYAVATEVSTTEVAKTKEKIAPTKSNLEIQKSEKKLVKDEEKNDGSVATKAYFQYTRMGGNLTLLSIFVSNEASHAAEIMSSFWLVIWAERTVSAMMEVATASSNFIPAGWLGLALSYSIEVTAFLKYGVHILATIEADMRSVECILYYSEEIEEESPADIRRRMAFQGGD
eukprot:15365627-Ditylum_brightwellii.AAC.1